MPLSDKEKNEARDALSLALELNEPETMLEGLKRLCVKKGLEAHISDKERDRWQEAAEALADVQRELELLERANKPQTSANDAQAMQGDAKPDC